MPSYEKSPNSKVIACFVLEFGAIYWAGGGKHLPPVLIGLRISESVRAYAYLILSSKASARSCIVGNMASSLTVQSAFLNNFENVVNRRVDISEDIKCYQNTLSYALLKVDYSVGEHLYMLPSDMTLKIRTGTVGYNNKILVSDGKFSVGTKG